MAMGENIDPGFELMLKTLGVFAFMFIDYKVRRIEFLKIKGGLQFLDRGDLGSQEYLPYPKTD